VESYLDGAIKAGLKTSDVLLIGRIYDTCMARGIEPPGIDYLLETPTDGLESIALNMENGKRANMVYGGVPEKLGTVDEMTLQLIGEKLNHEKYGPKLRIRLMGMLR